jgi:hypothetical protein
LKAGSKQERHTSEPSGISAPHLWQKLAVAIRLEAPSGSTIKAEEHRFHFSQVVRCASSRCSRKNLWYDPGLPWLPRLMQP